MREREGISKILYCFATRDSNGQTFMCNMRADSFDLIGEELCCHGMIHLILSLDDVIQSVDSHPTNHTLHDESHHPLRDTSFVEQHER